MRPDYATWLTMRPHVFGAIEAAAKLLDAQGKTPTTETITGLVGGCYSREVIEIACEELKEKAGSFAKDAWKRQRKLPQGRPSIQHAEPERECSVSHTAMPS